jgi:hypothetical protein
MANLTGFEPVTPCSGGTCAVRCATGWLMVEETGAAPASPCGAGGADGHGGLPCPCPPRGLSCWWCQLAAGGAGLSYSPEMVDVRGFEPPSAGCKPAALPIELHARGPRPRSRTAP